MQLIKTNDGLLGLKFSDRPVIWCDNKEELIRIGWANFAVKPTNHGQSTFVRDVNYALNYMSETGHTRAEFGVFGSFMYTSEE